MHLLLSHDDLGPWTPGPEGVIDAEGLALAYAYPELAGAQTWVRTNFVSTLDGAATGEDGRSGSINTQADRDVFGLLRALADVILIGAGTARAEAYQRAAVRAPWQHLRRGRPAHPTMAVVSRAGNVPPLLSQPREDSGDVLLITCARARDESIHLARSTLGEDHVIVAGEDAVDLVEAVNSLADRGLRRILCEGGPHLMRDLTASGCVDELCLTITPTLVAGDHRNITAGAAVTASFMPRLLIESEGALLGRWVRP